MIKIEKIELNLSWKHLVAIIISLALAVCILLNQDKAISFASKVVNKYIEIQ